MAIQPTPSPVCTYQVTPRPEESSSHVEPTGAVEGAKLPSSPGSSIINKVSFRNVKHPLLTKLRYGKRLDKKETAELVKKVFHIITEHTFFPSTAELVSYVTELLQEFPVLKEDNFCEAKRRWTILLQSEFCSFRKEIIEREQKPKVDAGTQTENVSVFQDMSRIVLAIKREFSKPEPDQEKIERLMCLTFQFRRSFIFNQEPKVICVQEVYPALFHCNQVCKEFVWITGKENDEMFFNNLKNYARIIYDCTRGSDTRRVIDLSIVSAKKKGMPYNWKTAALLLLPHLFKENHNFLWIENQAFPVYGKQLGVDDDTWDLNKCLNPYDECVENSFNGGINMWGFDVEQTEPYIKCNATLRAVAEGDGVFQIFTENILLAETSDFAVAVECFLASFFIFVMEYRADLKHTLQLLQSFFFEYDDPQEEDLHPRVIEVAEMLKNKMKRQNRFVRS